MRRQPRRGPGRAERETRERRKRARTHYARLRERRATQQQRRARFSALFALACAAGAAAGALRGEALLAELQPTGPRLATISVLGAERLAPPDVAAATGAARGAAIADLDPRAVVAKLESHPWIRLASARTLPGGTLVVGILEREPIALLKSDDADGWRAAARDGTPFAAVDPAAHPELLRLHSRVAIANHQPQPLVLEALELAAAAQARGLGRPQVVELPQQGNALGWVMRFEVDGAGPEIVLGHSELEARLTRLSELRAAKPEGLERALRIDLRFRNRAIVRAPDGTIRAPRSAPLGDASAATVTRDGAARADAASIDVALERLDPAKAGGETRHASG
jgi:cell division septal protein FtsQ